MSGTITVLAAAGAFAASHLVLSHPLRRPLVETMGERGFLVIYTLVAVATLGATVWAYRAAPATVPLWIPGDGLWALATLVMLLASILLLGSFVGNPTRPGLGPLTAAPPARGVFSVTRHPMMWAIALWGLAHILVYPVEKNIALAAPIVVLALVGAALQDRKKLALDPAGFSDWQARTSYWPFAAIARGRATFGGFGGHALGGGLVVWLVATWAHRPLAGWPAGIWRWLS